MSQGTIGYIISLIIAVISIASLFAFPKFWGKTAAAHKGAYVRIPLAIWIAISQFYWLGYSISLMGETDTVNEKVNLVMYWELCNIVAWAALVLVIVPNAFLLEIILPFALIGPTLTITTPTEEVTEFTFAQFRYYQYFFGHLGSLFAFLYIYLYGFTSHRFGWKFIKRSFLFAWCFLTFVALWNYMFPGSWDYVNHTEDVGDANSLAGPNFIFRDIFDNIGLGWMNHVQQYFALTYGIGPCLMLACYLLTYFVPPKSKDMGKTIDKWHLNTEFWVTTKSQILAVFNKKSKTKTTK